MNESERQKLRLQRQKERKRKKAKKNFLTALSIIIIVLLAFLITIKISNPDFDFSSLIPKEKTQQVVKFVNEDILGKTTTEAPTTTKPAAAETITKTADYDYVEFDEFQFDTALQGNQIGNLLNKSNGAVTYSSRYVYYSIPNKGIYKLEPIEEKNGKLAVESYNFKYLNVLGDYLYAVDTDSSKLMRIAVSNGDMMSIAEGISFAYLYNDKIYYIGTDNTVGYIGTSNLERTVLFSGQPDKTIEFAGISLSRIFFVQHDNVADYNEYITVSISDKNDKQYFKDDTKGDQIVNLHMEAGFMYYYEKQADGKFNLCRQKFGSEHVVTLLEDCNVTDYPVIYSNRLYYAETDDSKLIAKELNMNSMDTKTMISVSDADNSGTLGVGYGYQYVFLIGNKYENGDFICKGSCIYTSSSKENTISFTDDKLKY